MTEDDKMTSTFALKEQHETRISRIYKHIIPKVNKFDRQMVEVFRSNDNKKYKAKKKLMKTNIFYGE